MFYAALSLGLHQEPDPAKVDFSRYTRETQSRYGCFSFVEGTHFYDNFGHLSGYGASYYTYMWSLVIAKDMLTAFRAGGLMGLEMDRRFRDLVLAPGGSKDAAMLVRDFLGRDYDFEAYEKWLND
jgi:thimet oligopeptidase